MPLTHYAIRLAALVLVVASVADGATHRIGPDTSIQQTIDGAAPADVIVLADGVYHEAITVTKPLTIRAEHPGEVTITNAYGGKVTWRKADAPQTWYAEGIDWPVNGMRVGGLHAFDYRSKENFDTQMVGPYWSKGWQAEKKHYTNPPIYFAHDAATSTLWLKLDDDRDPNTINIAFNSADVDGRTLVQKDLGTAWNQQQIVVISKDPPVHPITHWYAGTPDNPSQGRIIDFPRICGITIDVQADGVTLEGLRVGMAPTVGVEVNNSHHVTIRDCYFSGYQFAINTGYECTNLTVEHCEMDGGRMVTFGRNGSVFHHMWNHCTYMNPVKFNGTGLTFRHNYVYEGYDLFHPRGRHKDFPQVPDIASDVAYNVWQNATDNALEFDSVEAMQNMRVHHNLILQNHDALAFTTTEHGSPLLVDHNIWWPGGGRIMKLAGTGRPNRGVIFVHNTYFTGNTDPGNVFEDSVFENNIVMTTADKPLWTPRGLGTFFPTRYNLLLNGDKWAPGFQGITAPPKFGDSPATFFVLQAGSPAIDAGRAAPAYHQDNVTDGKPDLGALEYGQTVEDWREQFGHCGPRWITPANAAEKAPLRPAWPGELDPRWGGLD